MTKKIIIEGSVSRCGKTLYLRERIKHLRKMGKCGKIKPDNISSIQKR